MYICVHLHCILQSMIYDGYKDRLYQIWQREVSRLWLAVFAFFILSKHFVSSELASDIQNYQFVNPNGRLGYMLRYIVPRDYDDSVMNWKAMINLNWQHFSKTELSYSNEDQMLSKTIIQSLTLILEEPVMLLSSKNTTFHDKTKPVIEIISLMASALSPPTILRHKLTRFHNHILQEGGVKLLSRESLFEHHNHAAQDPDIKTGQSMVPVAVPTTSKHGILDVCESCQMREKAKIKSLESIKNLILLRLQLQRLPNLTKPIAVPHNIIDKFYKNFNGAVTDNVVGYSMNSEVRNADLSGLRQLKKFVPILQQYTKITGMHTAHYQYGQQRLFDNQNTQGKYQAIHRSRSKPSLDYPLTHSNDKYEKLFEPIEHEQNDEDVQNDGLQLQYDDQQMLNINNQKEPTNYHREQLYPPTESDTYDGLSHENFGTYDSRRDVDDESLSHVNSVYIFASGKWLIYSKVKYGNTIE